MVQPLRLFKYNIKGSVLERQFKFGISAGEDVGVPINIIDPSVYRGTGFRPSVAFSG